MNTIYLSNNVKSNKTVVAVGNFDGVHKGHAELIKKAVKTAELVGAEPAVWTFENFLNKSSSNHVITPDKRLQLFREFGVTVVYTCDFNDVRDMSANEFVKKILIDGCHAEYAVCGYNFRFGKDASSDAKELTGIMRKYGKGSIIVSRVTVDGITVSSTAIRKALCEGNIELANTMLGRPFSIDMPVIHGNGIGTLLGFPTINQKYPGDLIIPRYGVYACKTYIDGIEYKAVSNIGVKPTVGNSELCCETFIIDYNGDLYGREMTVYFTGFLRDERKFDSLEELKLQIDKDVLKVKET